MDEISQLRDGIKFAPVKSKYKVFIVDESHQLTKEAANALLKTLEEPPSHAIFILATTEIHKMISTIISRCQRFDFRKLTIPEIVKELEIIAKKEGIRIEKSALELIALNSQGALRDAIGMLDQAITFCTGDGSTHSTGSGQASSPQGKDKEITVQEIKDLLGLVEISVISQFVDYLKAKDAKSAINFLNEIYEKGSDLEVFTKGLINYMRQILIVRLTGASVSGAENPIVAGLTKEEFQKLQTQAAGFQEKEIENILKLFLEAANKMKYSPIVQLPLELAIVEITNSTNNQ